MEEGDVLACGRYKPTPIVTPVSALSRWQTTQEWLLVSGNQKLAQFMVTGADRS